MQIQGGTYEPFPAFQAFDQVGAMSKTYKTGIVTLDVSRGVLVGYLGKRLAVNAYGSLPPFAQYGAGRLGDRWQDGPASIFYWLHAFHCPPKKRFVVRINGRDERLADAGLAHSCRFRSIWMRFLTCASQHAA
jgi:hypothetical protein